MTGDARGNLDFYTRVLGLRLVAKTVNQDDPGVYHLFYADERGTPGAELTFFEYPGLARGRAGAGMVHRIVSARRVRGGARLLAGAARRRGRRRGAGRRRRAALRRPRGPRPRAASWPARDRAAARRAPGGPGRARAAGLRGRARLLRRAASASGELLEEVLGAERVGDDDAGSCAATRRGATIAFDAPPRRAAPPGAGHGAPRRLGHHPRRSTRSGSERLAGGRACGRRR